MINRSELPRQPLFMGHCKQSFVTAEGHKTPVDISVRKDKHTLFFLKKEGGEENSLFSYFNSSIHCCLIRKLSLTRLHGL